MAAFVLNGAHTERANIAENLLVPVPEGVDPVEAVCLVLNSSRFAWSKIPSYWRAAPAGLI